MVYKVGLELLYGEKLMGCDFCNSKNIKGGYFMPCGFGNIMCCTKKKCMKKFVEATTGAK